MADGNDDDKSEHADDARATWAALDDPWRLAFEEAWASWCAGNFGIGAVLTDPTTAGTVVAHGRNRVAEVPVEPGVLAGNFMAHAEMNAFASMHDALSVLWHRLAA